MIVRVAGRELPLDRRHAGSAFIAARGWLRDEVASQPRRLRWVFAGLTLVIAAGALAAALKLPPGSEVLGTTPAVEWGLLIATYVFLVVTTSGLCLVNSLGMVFGINRYKPLEMRHVFLALLFLVSGFGVIALELQYPIRLVFGVVLSPSPQSPMWWMGVVYAGYLGVLVFELVTNMSSHRRLAHAACVISTGVAIVAPTTLGMVFASLVSRPFWQGSVAPVYLLITAVLSGASVLGIVFSLVQRLRLPGWGPDAIGVIVGIRRVLVITLSFVVAYTVIRTLVALTVGSQADREAVMALLVGPLGPQSWLLRGLVGLALPLAILLWPTRRTGLPVFIAGWLIMIGVFVDRLSFVTAGQIAPWGATSGIVSETYAQYFPSLDELGIVAGSIAVVILVYVLAERFLDLSSPGGSFAGDVHGVRASGARQMVRRPILWLGAGETPPVEAEAVGDPAAPTVADPPAAEPETSR
jgi:molybdopterin-containing oxidoreductase family membrane subunit